MKYLITILLCCFMTSVSVGQKSSDQEVLTHLYNFLYTDQAAKEKSIAFLEKNWTSSLHAPLIELIRMTADPWTRNAIVSLLESKTDQSFGKDLDKWNHWLWDRDAEYADYYFEFKAFLYGFIDEKFTRYFNNPANASKIRLDEVQWGGVKQDGIPPLRMPAMTNAKEATYLAPTDVVFGVSIDGEAHAYPKRILAYHEMFINQIGGKEIAGVYCTLCGTVIAYETQFNGIQFDLGTSGFLFRSNKLMYDQATQSLWSTVHGKPVIGLLTQLDIVLPTYSVVTTTWQEWRSKNPNTMVLSLNTGFQRDYSEGAAYREYFATDDLMFEVPLKNKQLKNKDEVLVVRASGYQDDPIAISIQFLKKNRVYQNQIGDIPFVVLTEQNGANRVYESGAVIFKKYQGGKLVDKNGDKWQVSESSLVHPNGKVLKRLPYHRIFWFAWYNTFPDTRLIK